MKSRFARQQPLSDGRGSGSNRSRNRRERSILLVHCFPSPVTPSPKGGGASLVSRECLQNGCAIWQPGAAYIDVRTLILLSILAVPALFGQSRPACDLVTQDEANALLGGSANPLSMGAIGCGYSVRTLGVRLTITVTDWGTTTKEIWDGLKATSAKKNWMAGDEAGMGSYAYAEVIRRSVQSSAGKCGFVIVKGTKILQLFVTDSAEKQDIAGRKEMLDKLRPLARKAVQRL